MAFLNTPWGQARVLPPTRLIPRIACPLRTCTMARPGVEHCRRPVAICIRVRHLPGSRREPENSSPHTLRQRVVGENTFDTTRAALPDTLTARYFRPTEVVGLSAKAKVPTRLCRPETTVRQTAPSRRWMPTQARG